MAKVTRLTVDHGSELDRRRLHLREISDDTDAPLETVGHVLRKARQRKGEDLAQVAAVLKLRKDQLGAIEEGNFTALPGRAYAIGFVRAYADYLGLDHQECVDRLKVEIAGRTDPADIPAPIVLPRERKMPQASVVFLFLLLAALAYGTYYVFVSAGNMASQPVLPVPDRLVAETSSQPAAPAAPAPSAVSPPSVEVPVTAEADPGVVSTPVASPPIPSASPTTTTNAGGAALADAASLPAGRLMGTQNRNSRISLRAHKQILVEVLGPDNTVFLRRQMLPGDVYQTPNRVGLTLSTPDSGAVEVILDGESQGFVGMDGDAVDGLSLNPQDVVDRAGGG
jgi:cytoskeleton protein RodZ